MLNKRIKSVLVAGLVILGIGFAKVDSYAAELSEISPTITTTGNNDYAINYENGGITVRIDYLNGDYTGTTYINTFTFCTGWEKDIYKVNGIEIKYAINGGEECLIEKEIENQNGMFSFNKEFEPGVNVEIKSVKVDYDLVDNNEEEEAEKTQESYVESIIKEYKESMEPLGKVSNDGSFRHIDKSYGINENDWNNFLTNFNNKSIKNNGMSIKYDENEKVYVVIENINNTIVERIQIEFIDTLDKGWIPEITPGTGQALAVGSIVIGAAAAVGLLVNNRKRKDEE